MTDLFLWSTSTPRSKSISSPLNWRGWMRESWLESEDMFEMRELDEIVALDP